MPGRSTLGRAARRRQAVGNRSRLRQRAELSTRTGQPANLAARMPASRPDGRNSTRTHHRVSEQQLRRSSRLARDSRRRRHHHHPHRQRRPGSRDHRPPDPVPNEPAQLAARPALGDDPVRRELVHRHGRAARTSQTSCGSTTRRRSRHTRLHRSRRPTKTHSRLRVARRDAGNRARRNACPRSRTRENGARRIHRRRTRIPPSGCSHRDHRDSHTHRRRHHPRHPPDLLNSDHPGTPISVARLVERTTCRQHRCDLGPACHADATLA